MKKKVTIHILLLLVLCACATKSSTPKECGENTALQGSLLGSVIGGIIGSISNLNPLASAVAGGVIGGVGGYQLASMQCRYYDKEQELLEKIQQSIGEQNSLVHETTAVNQKIAHLYNEVNLLKNTYGDILNKKELLKEKISLKKEEVLSIQKLNQDVQLKTTKYYQELKSRNYSKADNEKIKYSLQRILSSLNSIQKSCVYNLEQLDKFESRVQ